MMRPSAQVLFEFHTFIKQNQKANICKCVFEYQCDIKLVAREEGSRMFLCGEVHDDDPGSFKVAGFGYLTARDVSLHEILDLEDNWQAERPERGAPWLKTRLTDINEHSS